jgi:hypothetical protein
MFHFYKRSMDEAVGLWALPTAVLLRERGLRGPALRSHSNGESDFGERCCGVSRVSPIVGMCEHAYRLWKGPSVLAGILDFLWKPRQGEIPPKRLSFGSRRRSSRVVRATVFKLLAGEAPNEL